MKSINKYIIAAATLVSIYGCGPDGNSFRINGSFKDLKSGELYIYNLSDRQGKVDTVLIKNGEFKYKGNVSETTPYIIVFPNAMEQVIFVNGGEEITYKATANDVDWLMKVRMQGAIQKWVDHSISVTVNLPADVDEALVDRLYVEAWRSGCKGCTIYREGSRSGVMLSVSKKDKKGDGATLQPEPAPCKQPEVTEVRPKELECDVVRFQNNKEKWVAFVGLLNGYPYEIFTGLQDDEEGIVLPKTVTKGKIIKQTDENGKHRYDFQFENKRGYKTTVEGLSEKFNPEYWNYAKLISGVLRYRMPIAHVIKLVGSLQLKDESINTWKNGVERALKKYVVDGTEAKGQKCPVCGLESLVYQEGCLICKNCGASRCG